MKNTANPHLSYPEWIDEGLTKAGFGPEKNKFYKDRILELDPGLSFEEAFRKGISIREEFEQRQLFKKLAELA